MGLFSRFRSRKLVPADPLVEPSLGKEMGERDGVLGQRAAFTSIVNDPDAETKLRASFNPEDDGVQTEMINKERRDDEHNR